MEYKSILLALLFNIVYLQGLQIAPRISFGTDKNSTNTEHFTYLAALFDLEENKYCSGFVLSDKAILTAAHCVETKRVTAGFYIRSPDDSLSLIAADQISKTVIVHPDHNPNTKEKDLAVITLLRSLQIETPTLNITTTQRNENTKCIVSGFGADQSGDLDEIVPRFKEVEVIACNGEPSDHICAVAQINSTLRAGVLCDSDAGAPLVCNNELVGIAVSDNNCGTGGPDVYQSVIGFQSWIEEQIANAGQEDTTSTSTREPGSASTSVLNPFTMIATLSVILKMTLISISI